jgi:DNA-binding Lrp family transcriptional regulator
MLNFDTLDLRIIEGIGLYGPRNITNLAKRLGVPVETLRKRLKRLRSQIFLYANIYHTNLGLRKAVVHAQAVPGREQLLFDSLKMNDFWIYVDRCYGINEGCLGIYTIPKGHTAEFEDFVHELEKVELSNDTRIFWSTCFHAVTARCNWFSPNESKWVFCWDEWVNEIPTRTTQLPYTLIDPQDFPLLGDEIDVFILKELEKNPTVSLTDLAAMLGISQQLAEYHYRRHILARGLLEGFSVNDFRFEINSSDLFYFFLTFDSLEKLARFASSLLDKPFAHVLGKGLGKNSLFANIYLPKSEFRNFVDALSKLINMGCLASYSYVIQDIRKAQRQTISYEYFRNGGWIYDHAKHVRNLKGLIEQYKKTLNA